MIVKRKAYAYITRGNNLLLFTQPEAPEVGVQIPGGTIEEGEAPHEAVLREAREESGLTGLRLEAFLGSQEKDLSDRGLAEIHRRYFYHLICEQDCPATWRHGEATPSDGGTRFIPFQFFWKSLTSKEVGLTGQFDEMLQRLVVRIAREPEKPPSGGPSRPS